MPRTDQRPFWAIAAKLHKITWILDREADRLLHDRLKLSFPQFSVLMVVRHHPAITQRHIADGQGQTEGAISKRINELVKRRLISRTANPDSRREYRLTLTPAGERLFHRAIILLDRELAERFSSRTGFTHKHFGQSLDAMLHVLCPTAKRETPHQPHHHAHG